MTGSPPLTIAEAMSRAIAYQRAGDLREARALYAAILEARPEHAGANHNLGLIALQGGAAEVARKLLGRAVAAEPHQPGFHNSLGEALRVCGRPEEACAEFQEAARLAPSDPVPHNNLGVILAARDRQADAEAAFLRALALQPRYEKALLNLVAHGRPEAIRTGLERYLAVDPGDAVGARAMLAALGYGPTPERASAAHIERLYSLRADIWGPEAGYRAPQLVAGALAAALNGPVEMLDAGCGTGLLGPLLRPLATTLHGVDVSQPMLERARQVGAYDALYRDDLVEHLHAREAAYGAIASAATLIHFGDLSAPLQAAARALRPRGLLAFTVFPNDAQPDGYGVGELEGGRGGVFFHGRGYLASQAAAAGFELLSLTDEIHEIRDGRPYPGLLVACRKAV